MTHAGDQPDPRSHPGAAVVALVTEKDPETQERVTGSLARSGSLRSPFRRESGRSPSHATAAGNAGHSTTDATNTSPDGSSSSSSSIPSSAPSPAAAAHAESNPAVSDASVTHAPVLVVLPALAAEPVTGGATGASAAVTETSLASPPTTAAAAAAGKESTGLPGDSPAAGAGAGTAAPQQHQTSDQHTPSQTSLPSTAGHGPAQVSGVADPLLTHSDKGQAAAAAAASLTRPVPSAGTGSTQHAVSPEATAPDTAPAAVNTPTGSSKSSTADTLGAIMETLKAKSQDSSHSAADPHTPVTAPTAGSPSASTPTPQASAASPGASSTSSPTTQQSLPEQQQQQQRRPWFTSTPVSSDSTSPSAASPGSQSQPWPFSAAASAPRPAPSQATVPTSSSNPTPTVSSTPSIPPTPTPTTAATPPATPTTTEQPSQAASAAADAKKPSTPEPSKLARSMSDPGRLSPLFLKSPSKSHADAAVIIPASIPASIPDPISRAVPLAAVQALPDSADRSVGAMRERAQMALRAAAAASEASQRAAAYSAAATTAASKAADAAERAASAASFAQGSLVAQWDMHLSCPHSDTAGMVTHGGTCVCSRSAQHQHAYNKLSPVGVPDRRKGLKRGVCVQVSVEGASNTAMAAAEVRLQKAAEMVKEAEQRAAHAAALATAYQDVSQTQEPNAPAALHSNTHRLQNMLQCVNMFNKHQAEPLASIAEQASGVQVASPVRPKEHGPLHNLQRLAKSVVSGDASAVSDSMRSFFSWLSKPSSL
ncbi:MAG: hypothetical protein WDW38_004310 [Sanguina aurantia]